MTTDDFPKPKFITGGCLCGALRYRADFAPTHDFRESVSRPFIPLFAVCSCPC